MIETRESLEAEIFNLRKSISLQLRANNPETANKLLDRVTELERKKQNLGKPGGTHER